MAGETDEACFNLVYGGNNKSNNVITLLTMEVQRRTQGVHPWVT
jgi:hypothetical protein